MMERRGVCWEKRYMSRANIDVPSDRSKTTKSVGDLSLALKVVIELR